MQGFWFRQFSNIYTKNRKTKKKRQVDERKCTDAFKFNYIYKSVSIWERFVSRGCKVFTVRHVFYFLMQFSVSYVYKWNWMFKENSVRTILINQYTSKAICLLFLYKVYRIHRLIRFIYILFYFLSVSYWLCYYSCLSVFLPFLPLCPAPSHPPAFPRPVVHVHGSYT